MTDEEGVQSQFKKNVEPPVTVASGSAFVAQYEDEKGDTVVALGQQQKSSWRGPDPFTCQRRKTS